MKTIPEYQILSYRFSLNPKKLTELYHNFADDYLAVKHAVQDSKSKRVRDIEKYLKKTSDVDLRFLKKTWKLRGSNLKYKMADHIPIGSLDLPTALAIRLKVILGSDSIPGTTSLTLGTAKQKQQQQQKAKAKAKAVEQQSKQRDAIYKEYRTLMKGLGMNLMYDIDALFREFKKPVSEKLGARLRGDKAPQWLYDRLDEYRLKYMIPGHIPRVWIKDACRRRLNKRTVKPKGGELIDKRNGPPPERMNKYELVLERPILVQEYGWTHDVHLDVTKAYKKFKKDRNESWNLIVKDFIDLYSAAPDDSLYIKTTRTNTDYYNTYAPKYEELVEWRDYISDWRIPFKFDYSKQQLPILSPSDKDYAQYKDKLLARFRYIGSNTPYLFGIEVHKYLLKEEKKTLELWSKQKKWKNKLDKQPRKARLLLKKEVKNHVTRNRKAINLEFSRRGYNVYSERNIWRMTKYIASFNDSVPRMAFWDMTIALRSLIGFQDAAPQNFKMDCKPDFRFYYQGMSQERKHRTRTQWGRINECNPYIWEEVRGHQWKTVGLNPVNSHSLEKKVQSIYDKYLKGKAIDWYDCNIVNDLLYFVAILKDEVLVFTFNLVKHRVTHKVSSRKRTPASMKRALELLEKK